MKTPIVVAFLLLASCSHHSSSGESTANAADPAEGRTEAPRGTFGARCKTDAECNAGGVCFHRKPRAKEGEQGGGRERAFCSMSCASDSDCQSPPTSGHCNVKKKICTRVKGHGGQQPSQPSQPGEPSDEEVDDDGT